MTRVHKLVDKQTWTARYKRIREFEALLAENGTTVIKFFLLNNGSGRLRALKGWRG